MWKSLRLRVALPPFVFLAVAAALIVYLTLPRQSEVKTLAVLPRYQWGRRNIEGLKNSVAHFDQAIRLDSNYALAYAALADSYITLGDYRSLPARGSYPKAKAAALKALELDDTLAEAHTSLAMIKASYEWDWPGAEQSFQRAIELNPN